MPTYEKIGKHVGVRRMRSAYVLNTLQGRCNTSVCVVVRRRQLKILCMHKIPDALPTHYLYVGHTLDERYRYVMYTFLHATHKLPIR